MASLYRLLRKGKITIPSVDDIWGSVLARAMEATKQPNCILVNIDSVSADVVAGLYGRLTASGEVMITVSEIPPCTPPFKTMWLECVGKWAMLIERLSVDNGFELSVSGWYSNHDGNVLGPIYIHRVDLDQAGVPRKQFYECVTDTFEDPTVAFARTYTGLHALARMNCRNATLRVIAEPKLVPHHQRRPVPASVWHQIVISDSLKFQTTGKDGLGADPKLIRNHWVRGHYADYRKAGLFGRAQSRGIYWIPEYKRGNEELGQVVPEYAFQR